MGYWSELRAWLFKDPRKLIRYLVLFICSIIVIVQLYECFSKLYDPPISTHSYFNINDSIEMPAVTLCREPPYKEEVLTDISGQYCPHPKYVMNCWRYYPYGEVELEEYFRNATFDFDETFIPRQYGLSSTQENLEITDSIHFQMGRCYTVRPKVPLKKANRDSGYSLMLKHHVKLAQGESHYSHYTEEPGWHIFIHDKRENFTEVNMKGSGRVEYVFAAINEEIEIKLQTNSFSNVETRHEICSRKEGYSDLKCGEVCIWEKLAALSNCTAPWMHDVPQNPCDNYNSMRNLTNSYILIYNSEDDVDCGCLDPCDVRLFSTYIQRRKEFIQATPSTQIWIYYTTKLVSMVEERESYDPTQFIADVGGSLGFLLGLSVLGLIIILEHIMLFFCGGIIRKMQQQEEKKKLDIESDSPSQGSANTVDIANVAANKAAILDRY